MRSRIEIRRNKFEIDDDDEAIIISLDSLLHTTLLDVFKYCLFFFSISLNYGLPGLFRFTLNFR